MGRSQRPLYCRDVTGKIKLYSRDDGAGQGNYILPQFPGRLDYRGLVALYDTMKLIAAPITVIVTGMAASMGSILLSAAPKGRRLLYPHARVLIHQPLIMGRIVAPARWTINIQAQEMEENSRRVEQTVTWRMPPGSRWKKSAGTRTGTFTSTRANPLNTAWRTRLWKKSSQRRTQLRGIGGGIHRRFRWTGFNVAHAAAVAMRPTRRQR